MQPMSEAGQGAEPSKEVPSTDQSGTAAGAEQTAPEGDKQEAKEDLILGKFKSQEDLANAYKELESHSKKVEMDKADLDKFVKEAYGDAETQPKTEQEKATPEAPKGSIEELKPHLAGVIEQMMTPAIAKIETQHMVDKYGEDFKANASKVASAKRENPSLSLEDAYKLVTYDSVATRSESKGVEKASQTAEQKVKAQVESTKPSGAVTSSSIEDAVRDPNVGVADVAEALGPEYKKFAEISRKRKGR
jgi:hypothetical protein